MSHCGFDVVLYFYGEMDAADRPRADAHVRGCAECRQRLEELEAIRHALSLRPQVDAPPAGDWSGFMRRLDEAVKPGRGAAVPPAAVLEPQGTTWTVRHVAALAAMLAVVASGVWMAARFKATAPAPAGGSVPGVAAAGPAAVAHASEVPPGNEPSLRAVSAEHLERSKLVVLGLATRDPRRTTAADWQYERRLAESLLSDTRLYRIAAQDRGVTDVARVMRDLETVLLEASLSDSADKDALERVQRLIAKRDLVVKMQMVAGSAGL
jgi:hypothetical protein